MFSWPGHLVVVGCLLVSGGVDAGEVAAVVRVVDGDTLVVSVDGTPVRVRLIGVDTPERGECWYDEAAAGLAELVGPGVAVRLAGDVSLRDRYGRRLSYVYRVSDGVFVNLNLVESGLAVDARHPPDVRYADVFASASVIAQANGLGRWSHCKEV